MIETPKVPNPASLVEAHERFTNVVRQTSDKDPVGGVGPTGSRHPMWYRGMYMLAVVESSLGDQGPAKDWPNALETAISLATAIETSLIKTKGRRTWINLLEPEPRRTSIDDFLEDIEAEALILCAGLMVARIREAVYLQLPEAVQLAAASSWDRYGVLQALHVTDGQPAYLVAFVTHRLKLSAKANYNLACYYSQVGEAISRYGKWDDALSIWREGYRLLETALAGLDDGTRKWAAVDPSLTSLRRYAEEFRSDRPISP